MKTITDQKQIEEVFNRGTVADIIPLREELLKFLLAGKRLKIYIGLDPTATSLHLGHASNLLFLEDLRRLGHEVVMLVGDFTARIGDPSGRTTARQPLSETQIKENMKGWVAQVQPILGLKDKKNPVRIAYNSTWLSKLRFEDILNIASQFTVQQMMERDMFEKRWREDLPIHLHEFLYPLMQGYDSVALDVNAELCGTDQLFNALAGRMLLKRLKNRDKFVITLKLLQNPKTGEMMSKSKGTGVFLSASANDLYGAIMAQPDEMTETLFIHCTRVPLDEINKIIKLNPKATKMSLALEITKMIHGEPAARKAQENFEKVFSRHEMPDDVPILKISVWSSARPKEDVVALDIVVASGVLKSKSEARRLIEQGGFEFNEKVIKNPLEEIAIRGGETIRIGKKNFFKLIA